MPERTTDPAREPGALPENAPCPFCEGTDTRLINPFGGQLSVAQYWCNRCRTGFEYLKWEAHDDEDERE